MSYNPMTVEDFGAELLRTGDLDPIYVMLNSAGLTQEQKIRWCLAYWCFYHAGFASYATDAETNYEFWARMKHAAENIIPAPGAIGRWPRGGERRHFRARTAINAVDWLTALYPDPTSVLPYLLEGGPAFLAVRDRVMKWPAFGPWIAFKVCDMVDAVLGQTVDFNNTEQHFFEPPKEGAAIVAQQRGVKLTGTNVVKYAVETILNDLEEKQIKVPHAPHRLPREQEAETILCKYKSHVKGNYPVGKDTREIKHGLAVWLPYSVTAKTCYSALDRMERRIASQ
jgi:hypothetical protein